jgi:hypothetical protein
MEEVAREAPLLWPLGKEGLHFLVDEMIVLALRGGAEMQPRQGEGRWGSEVRMEALYGFQSVWSAAEDIFPKWREVLETAPHPLDCRRRGEAKMENERSRPGSSDETGSTGAWICPAHRPTRHVTQLRAEQPPLFL